MPNCNELIYHYCSMEVFESIIKKKIFWLTNHSGMNDENEILWNKKLVSKAANELKKELSGTDVKYLELFMKEFENIETKDHYLICFSNRKDIQNQWKMYADHDKGVAISFSLGLSWELLGLGSKSESTSEVSKNNYQATTQKIGYDYVVYDDGSYVKNALRKIVDGRDQSVKNATLFFSEMQTFIKDPKYKSEDEVRILYTPRNIKNLTINSQYDQVLKRLSSKKSYNDRNYYEFDISCDCMHLLISEIILGKECDISLEEIRIFLDKYGFKNTRVYRRD